MLLTHCCVCVSMARLSFFYVESYTWSSSIQNGTQLLRCDYKSGYTSAPQVFRFVDVSYLVKLLSKIRGFCYFRMFSENDCELLEVYWAQNMYLSQLSVPNISLIRIMFVELCSRYRMTAYNIQRKMSVVFGLYQLQAFCVHQFY
jgi:hypothetical protein